MTEPNKSSSTSESLEAGSPSVDFLLAEFSALRDNIMDSTNKQYQQITIALGGFGALASFALGLTDKNTSSSSSSINSDLLILIYPFLSVFLAFLYYEQEAAIQRIAHYIRTRIEYKFLGSGGGWEEFFIQTNRKDPVKRLSSKTIFLSTQIIAIVIYSLQIHKSIISSVANQSNFWEAALQRVGFTGALLLLLDIVIIFITFWITTKKTKFWAQ